MGGTPGLGEGDNQRRFQLVCRLASVVGDRIICLALEILALVYQNRDIGEVCFRFHGYFRHDLHSLDRVLAD